MSDKYQTAPVSELIDPLVQMAPKGTKLLVVNPGGVLLVSEWFAGAVAWGPMPKLPASVKERMNNV